MESHRYQALLENPSTFTTAATQLSYAEIVKDEETSDYILTKGKILEHDVESWLRTGSGSAQRLKPCQSLRIVACIAKSRDARKPPLALSRHAFEAIVKHFAFPPSLLARLCTRTSCFSRFENEETSQHGFTFQTVDKKGLSLACALSQAADAQSTCVFLYGLLEAEFSVLCAELEQSPGLFNLPTFIPTCLIQLKAETVEEALHDCNRELHDVKVNIGMTKQGPCVATNHMHDFTPVSHKLARLSVGLAKCELTCQAHLSSLTHIDLENNDFLARITETKRATFAKSVNVLQRRQTNLRQWMEALEPRARYLDKRAQAYVQTVYSLMAQKDNALNVQMAEASLRVAEASYRDSVAMKAIAEDSKQVTIATSRDSSLMSIISVLTLIYLPSTFTATLFSTEFFSFRDADSQGIVSPWFWLYWLVTLALTACTAAFAGYFWRMRRREMVRAFERAGGDRGGTGSASLGKVEERARS